MWQIIALSVVQGLTEFLPISSSAHLILANQALGYEDQGLVFDVATHLGSLAAVMLFFRRELLAILTNAEVSSFGKPLSGFQLAGWLILATIPIGLTGLLGADFIEQHLRAPVVIAMATIVFALALWWADRDAGRRNEDLQFRHVIWMALGQVLALIPGTSRSGITMTAGLAAGLSRTDAARFSFLMAIPAIGAAGSFGVKEMLEGSADIAWVDFGLAVFFSALAALACITVFLKLVERIGMLPFVIYRLILGAVLLFLIF